MEMVSFSFTVVSQWEMASMSTFCHRADFQGKDGAMGASLGQAGWPFRESQSSNLLGKQPSGESGFA